MLGYTLRNNPCEIYRVHISGNEIIFTVKDTLVQDILEKVKQEEALETFLSIARKVEGDFVYFSIKLPYITFPNYAHRGIDWKELEVCTEKIALLLSLCNMYLSEKHQDKRFQLSDYPQLVTFSTGYYKERSMHACPLEVGFSEDIALLLAKKFQKEMSIDTAAKEASHVYLSLSSKRKKDFDKDKKDFEDRGGMFGVVAKVRSQGTPQFSVPGNCACLGENPDIFSYSRDMHSHNLDTTLQQITMFSVVVSFWNTLLKPLYEENIHV